MPHWASCAEGEENHWGQGMRKGWEVETYRGEGKEKMVGVFEEALEWSFDQKYYFFGGC